MSGDLLVNVALMVNKSPRRTEAGTLRVTDGWGAGSAARPSQASRAARPSAKRSVAERGSFEVVFMGKKYLVKC